MHQIASFIVKRGLGAADDVDVDMASLKDSLPEWTGLLFGLEFAILLPVIFWVTYTLSRVYATLAMIEDEAAPTYSRLPSIPIKTESDVVTKDPSAPLFDTTPITANVCRTARHLKTFGGFRACFRGFVCMTLSNLVLSLVTCSLMLLLPAAFKPFCSLAGSLAVAQFMAAWVHIIMTPGSSRSWFKRMPAFGPTMRATSRAIVLNWAATHACVAGYTLIRSHMLACSAHHAAAVAAATGVDPATPTPDARFVLLDIAMAVVYALVVVPTEVLLARSRASLLPAEEDSIINFDRSLGGRVTETGFVSLVAVWKSVGATAWKRIAKFHMRIFAVAASVLVPVTAMIAMQLYVLRNMN
ncbi:hypothetical protein CFIMG_002147RA [Ceratocystis fimbriata CBS 114723]|uniref:Ubiquitin carrier protein n=1 Tax=Ceratocystis fimbriata CBS 114723 TaxID=1035309 RepID=A0A2C5XAL0_9PEZI|nr:hypothetical protein CFIMG_002147RA [Ceratocystis fimbriata CBS 114723]